MINGRMKKTNVFKKSSTKEKNSTQNVEERTQLNLAKQDTAMIHFTTHIETAGFHIENIGAKNISFETDILTGRSENKFESTMKTKRRRSKI